MIRRPFIFPALLVAAVVAFVAIAPAADKGTSRVTLCASKKGGELSAPRSRRCGRDERKLTVSRRGARGPVGAPGPVGDRGPRGEPGHVPSLSATPFRQVGEPGPDCAATLVFCSNENGYWSIRTAPVGYRVDPSGVIHLQGFAGVERTGAGGSPPRTIFVLPEGARPQQELTFATVSSSSQYVRVFIGTDGTVDASNGDYVTLGGISFIP